MRGGGNLVLLCVNRRKPNKQALLEAGFGLAMDIWRTLPCFPISTDCPRAAGALPWVVRVGGRGLACRLSPQGQGT